MALNFGLLGDAGAPAMGYLQGQQDVARNQLAQQQIETGRMTQDKMRMEMDAFKRRQAGLDQFMNKAKELGVNGDPEQLTQAYWEHAISTGDPNEIKAAMIAVQTAKERKAYMGGQPPAAGAVATPVPMTNNLGTALSPAGTLAPANAMAVAPTAAPAQGNALAAPAGNRLAQIENRMAELRRFPNLPEAKQEHAELIKERDRLMTPHVVGDNLVTLGGGVNYTAPAKAGAVSPLARLQNDRQTLILSGVPTNDPRVKQFDAMIAKETTHAPGTVVNVSQSTEKKFGEAFGTKIADRDVAMLDVAAKAPDLAANANRVLGILSQGNVFTGTAADMKLNMARALNLAGADNNEKIANTEMLMSGLARQTLGAVKSSGLGTGQGFTDKDLQFLQDVEGGRITMNIQSIQRLAELSHSAADKSATAWNKRVKEIPKSAIEGTGLSTEPIVVPKRFGAVATPAAPAAGAVQNGYRFKGGDPAVAANWEKL